MVDFKKMLNRLHEKQRIEAQKKREQMCLVFFANEWKFTEHPLDDFAIPYMPKGIFVMRRQAESTWPYQSYLLNYSLCSERLQLNFGDFTKSYKEGEKLYRISEIPDSLWMNVDDFPRPTQPCWILCRYTDDYYEVVNYSEGAWITELYFPVKPKAFFVLQYIC